MFLGIYNYTVYLTYLNLLIGFLGIFITIENNNEYNLKYSFVCLLLSGICDMFDGIISNLKKERTLKEKRYGIQIDSLADIISFGILPILIGWKLYQYQEEYYSTILPKELFFIIVSLYILTILIRLAYFNVMAEKYLNLEKLEHKGFENTKIFIGVPVTISSFLFPFLFLIKNLIKKIFPFFSSFFLIIYLFFILFLSFLFVFDKIKLKKPRYVSIIMFLSLLFFLLVFILIINSKI